MPKIMTSITISNLDESLLSRLQKRAEDSGLSLEEEVKEILQAALLTEKNSQPLNLAEAIERGFAHLGEFEIPTIVREPMREHPNFEDLHDYT